MKLSLVKPLSAMLASVVMCGVFSLSFTTNAKKHCLSDQLESQQQYAVNLPCYFADGKILGWEEYMTTQEKKRLEKAFKEIEQLQIKLIKPVKLSIPQFRV